MKTITISLIIGILLVGLVIGGEVLTSSTFDKTAEIDKVSRDYLLTKVPTTYDKDSKPITKEIKPVINIDCNEKQCKYSAVQEGIIFSYDNMIDREYCSKYNETYIEEQDRVDGRCIEYSYYTIGEIETQVADAITQRLKDYVNASIERDTKVFEKASEGTVEIREKVIAIK